MRWRIPEGPEGRDARILLFRIREHIPTVIVVAVATLLASVYLVLALILPPPERRAFRPEWNCYSVAGGEGDDVCERSPPGMSVPRQTPLSHPGEGLVAN